MGSKAYSHSTRHLANCVFACLCLWGLPTHGGIPTTWRIQDENIAINFAQGEDYRVKVDTVQPVRTSEGQLLFRLSYNYQFKKHRAINIKGVGTVPGSGKGKHLFAGEYLEFWDTSGRLLVKIKLKPNKPPSEGGGLDLPQENEFVNFLSDTAHDPIAFLPKALQKLNDWFPTGYTIRQKDRVTSLVTTYRDVEGLPANLRGQIAIQLSYPYDSTSNQFFFRVYVITRQRPKKSADWVSPTPETQKVFNDFAIKLVREFK